MNEETRARIRWAAQKAESATDFILAVLGNSPVSWAWLAGYTALCVALGYWLGR